MTTTFLHCGTLNIRLMEVSSYFETEQNRDMFLGVSLITVVYHKWVSLNVLNIMTDKHAANRLNLRLRKRQSIPKPSDVWVDSNFNWSFSSLCLFLKCITSSDRECQENIYIYHIDEWILQQDNLKLHQHQITFCNLLVGNFLVLSKYYFGETYVDIPNSEYYI